MARTPISLPISGKKLRELRDLAGLEQTEVAGLTEEHGHKVAQSRISRIETEQVKPTAKQLQALLAVYRVPVEQVLVCA